MVNSSGIVGDFFFFFGSLVFLPCAFLVEIFLVCFVLSNIIFIMVIT